MTDRRLGWIVLACILVGAAGVVTGSGAVAVFSDTETVSGSFSVDSEYDPGQPTSSNGTGPANGTGPTNETGVANETAPQTGNTSENDSKVSEPNGSAIDVTSVALLGDDAVAIGETATVQVRGVNRGNESRPLAATLRVDGNATDANETSVAPNETASLTLTHAFENAGNYTLRAAGSLAGQVTVSAPVPSISVIDASLDGTEITPNESVPVEAIVENSGTGAGSIELALTANGTELDRMTVQVDPGDRETVTFHPAFETAGTYDLAVDGVDAGSVLVAAEDDVENGTDGTGDSTAPNETSDV